MSGISPGLTKHNFDCVVLDGSNILHLTTTTFSFERLKKTVDAVERLGWKTNIIMKTGTRDWAMKKDSNLTVNERQSLKQWIEFGRVNLAPRSTEKEIDDILAIRYALAHNAWIVSHDKFRLPLKLLKEKGDLDTINEINKRRIQVEFGPDNTPIFTPELPVNLSSKTNSKTVAETMEFELNERSDGINFAIKLGEIEKMVTVPLRKPIGREFFYGIDGIGDMQKIGQISKRHFRMDWDGKTSYVTDVGSTNGTRDEKGNQLIPNTPEPIDIGSSFGIPGLTLKRVD